ncbi:MAG: ABC transporter ATP-binding protein [Planctomycetia bacterium]|nr:ABC transporter ATP-binding protein [Planctomycetia bacterium]
MTMDRNPDNTPNKDAQILSRLRRRSTTLPPNPERAQEEPQSQMRTNLAKTPVEENAGQDATTSRAEALKRLVATDSARPKMTPLSSTVRELRDVFAQDAFDSYAPNARADDASNELIEAAIDASNTTAPDSSVTVEDNVAAPQPRVVETQVAQPKEPQTSAERMPQTALESANISNRPRINVVSDARPQRETANVNDSLMVVSNLVKTYGKPKNPIPVLRGVNLTVEEGELLAIVGQSGSGKSTLLHLMGTLDTPTAGSIHFDRQRIDNLPARQCDVLRNRFISMIFQFYHLIPEMSTLENVLAPLMIHDSFLTYFAHRSKYVKRAKEMLGIVGLTHRLDYRPKKLSGGEMQRVAIARALMTNPRILLADEPTGNLDSKTAVGVMELLRKLNKEQKLTIVMVTHNMAQAQEADRYIRLVDGKVAQESAVN